MVSLAFEKILLQLLAAVVIQFTPVDTCLEPGKTWTWGDGKSIWYTLSPAKAADGTVTYAFNRFEGEVRVADHVTLTLAKQPGGGWQWARFRTENSWESADATLPLPSPAKTGTVPPHFFPAPWAKNNPAKIPFAEEKQLTHNGLACRMLVYSQDRNTVCVLLHRGTVYGLSLSTTGKLFPAAEHRLVRENPGQ